jgi:two-component system, OmpR family, KDP operon response regulator KdpE
VVQPPVPDDLSILVVEDEAPNRALVRAVLARSSDSRIVGAKLLEAPTLGRARELLAEQAIDLVLLDVRLPDGNGLDLATELRGSEHRPKVIVLSASVLPNERDAAMRAGGDAFLAKPYRPADLFETMDQVLRSEEPDSG